MECGNSELGRIVGMNGLSGMMLEEWNGSDGMEWTGRNIVGWLEWVD